MGQGALGGGGGWTALGRGIATCICIVTALACLPRSVQRQPQPQSGGGNRMCGQRWGRVCVRSPGGLNAAASQTEPGASLTSQETRGLVQAPAWPHVPCVTLVSSRSLLPPAQPGPHSKPSSLLGLSACLQHGDGQGLCSRALARSTKPQASAFPSPSCREPLDHGRDAGRTSCALTSSVTQS